MKSLETIEDKLFIFIAWTQKSRKTNHLSAKLVFFDAIMSGAENCIHAIQEKKLHWSECKKLLKDEVDRTTSRWQKRNFWAIHKKKSNEEALKTMLQFCAIKRRTETSCRVINRSQYNSSMYNCNIFTIT